jgi:hypothetical protein
MVKVVWLKPTRYTRSIGMGLNSFLLKTPNPTALARHLSLNLSPEFTTVVRTFSTTPSLQHLPYNNKRLYIFLFAAAYLIVASDSLGFGRMQSAPTRLVAYLLRATDGFWAKSISPLLYLFDGYMRENFFYRDNKAKSFDICSNDF